LHWVPEEIAERSPALTKRLFPADSVFWLVSMPEGTPSETMWPAFAFWDDDEEDCVGLRGSRLGG